MNKNHTKFTKMISLVIITMLILLQLMPVVYATETLKDETENITEVENADEEENEKARAESNDSEENGKIQPLSEEVSEDDEKEKTSNYVEKDTNNTIIAEYDTLSEAFEKVTSGNTIFVMQDVTEDAIAKLEDEKDVTLSTNVYTINMGSYYVENSNNGTLTITGDGIISSSRSSWGKNYGVYNNSLGIINIVGGTIDSSNSYVDYGTSGEHNSYGIYNNSAGTINIDGGTINSSSSSKSYGVYNSSEGTINIREGTINSSSLDMDYSYGVYNNSGGTVNIEGGTINSSTYYTAESRWCTSYGVYNNSEGNINIVEGTINSSGLGSGTSYGVYNNSEGNIDIERGTINSSSNSGNSFGVSNDSGKIINIEGGTINSSSNSGNSYGVSNYSRETVNIGVEVTEISTTTPIIKSKSINGTSYGVYMSSNYNGIVNIKSGTVNSSSNNEYSYGVYNISKGTINIGVEDAEVSTTTPVIRNESNGQAIYNYSSDSTINFYDGIIEDVVSITNLKKIESNITALPEGYKIKYEIDFEGTKHYTATLGQGDALNKYEEYNGDTLINKYETLQDAFDNAISGNTIKLTDNALETISTVLSGEKNIELNLNGYTLGIDGNLQNNGTGKLNIKNEGNVKSDYLVNVSSGEIDIEGGKINSNVINSSTGMVNITGGTINNRDGGRSTKQLNRNNKHNRRSHK